MNRLKLLIPALAVLLLAPAAQAASPAPTSATAHIMDAGGRSVGTATFSTLASGAVHVMVQVAGFNAGTGGNHGIHVHTVGKCDGPGFTTAGAHFNPTMKMHGLDNPKGAHAGDLPNIQFYPDGSATYSATTTAFTMKQVLDADGSAIVIHAAPDDEMTDPSGNSGARIGCGVIMADTASAMAPSAASMTSAPAAMSMAKPMAATAATIAMAKTSATSATAHIMDAGGRPVGTATLTTLASGAIQVAVQVAGYNAGPGGNHGIHVHTVGKCDGPAFTTAGAHFNPTMKMHGLDNPQGAHAGDLPNIQFYPDGSATYSATTTAFTMKQVLDADGSAIVIHAAPDDEMTDPSGNSGARIGCGVIVADTSTG